MRKVLLLFMVIFLLLGVAAPAVLAQDIGDDVTVVVEPQIDLTTTVAYIQFIGMWATIIITVVALIYLASKNQTPNWTKWAEEMRKFRESEVFSSAEVSIESLPDPVQTGINTAGDAISLLGKMMPEGSLSTIATELAAMLQDLADGEEESPA